MNLDFLESFRVFAQTLNFSHAATQRHLSQPALHKQIRALQEDIGTQLYRRVGRNLELTEGGHRLARLAIETRNRIDDCRADILNENRTSSIGLVAGRGAYLYLLGRGIQRFTKKGLKVDLMTGDSPATLLALKSGRAALGVTVVREIPEGYFGEMIREVRPHLVVSQSHALASRKSVGLKQLNTLPLILPPTPSPMRESLTTIFEHEDCELSIAMEASGWELMMHFASLGLGATIVNGCCRPPRGTVAIPIPSLPSAQYYLLHMSDPSFSDATRELYRCIQSSAKGATLVG